MNFSESLQTWATQTILHTMSVKSAPTRDQLSEAVAKANKTAQWLWDESVAVEDRRLHQHYIEKVLDWTWHHRNGLSKK